MKPKYRILIVFMLIVNSIVSQENTLGTIFIDDEVSDGLTIFSSGYDTYIIDNCGRVINKWSSDYRVGQSAYLLEDGRLLRTGTENEFGYGGGGLIELFDWDGNLLWRDFFNTETLTLHHDIQPLPNGNILALAYSYKSEDESWAAGAQDSVDYFTTAILEIKPIGTDSSEVVWEWELWDHLIQEVDSTRSNFGDIDENPQLFDVNRRDFSGYVNGYSDTGPDLMHMNSINYNKETDEILLSSRDQYEIFIIDHSTTTLEAAGHNGGNQNKGGDFIYRRGSFYGQHDAHWTNGDTIVLFNNGFRHNDQSRNYGSVDRFVPKRDSSNSYVYNEVLSYEEAVSSQGQDYQLYSTIMGSGQVLDNGNILVCDSDDGLIYEFNKEEEIVWTYANPLNFNGVNTQGDPANSIPLIFRAKKIKRADIRFSGKELTPKDPIELDFDIQMCLDLTDVVEVQSTDVVKIYPNPVQDFIKLESSIEIEEIVIYNSIGGSVLKSKYLESIDVSYLKGGLYYMNVFDEKGRNVMTKFIKL